MSRQQPVDRSMFAACQKDIVTPSEGTHHLLTCSSPHFNEATVLCWTHCYVTTCCGSDFIPATSTFLRLKPHDMAYPAYTCSSPKSTGAAFADRNSDTSSFLVCMYKLQRWQMCAVDKRQDVVMAQHEEATRLILCIWYEGQEKTYHKLPIKSRC